MQAQPEVIGIPSPSISPKKSRLSTFVKISVGVALISFLIYSEKLSLSALSAALMDIPSLLINFVLLFLLTIVGSKRWATLANAQGNRLSVWECFRVHMLTSFLAMFFSSSLAIDVARAYYVASADKKNFQGSIAGVIGDRAVSAWGLFVFTSLSLLAVSHWSTLPPELDFLRTITFVAAILGSIGAIVVVMIGNRVARLLQVAPAKPQIIGKIFGLLRALVLFSPSVLAKALGWSFLMLSLTVGLAVLQGQRLNLGASLETYLVLWPLTCIANYLAIVPFGIGVSQIALVAVFHGVGASGSEKWVALCTVLQIYNILFHLWGGYFYFKDKRL